MELFVIYRVRSSLHTSQVAHQVRAYHGFSSGRLGVCLLFLDGMIVHHRVTPSICTPGLGGALGEQSVLPKNTAQCPRPGLKPGPLALEWSTLTMGSLGLLFVIYAYCELLPTLTKQSNAD